MGILDNSIKTKVEADMRKVEPKQLLELREKRYKREKNSLITYIMSWIIAFVIVVVVALIRAKSNVPLFGFAAIFVSAMYVGESPSIKEINIEFNLFKTVPILAIILLPFLILISVVSIFAVFPIIVLLDVFKTKAEIKEIKKNIGKEVNCTYKTVQAEQPAIEQPANASAKKETDSIWD